MALGDGVAVSVVIIEEVVQGVANDSDGLAGEGFR